MIEVISLKIGVYKIFAETGGENRGGENEINQREQNAAGNAEHNWVAYAARGVFRVLFTERNAYKGAAAVAYHYGDAERYYREREYNRIGGVSVGSQVVGIGDEDLINDVIERADQKRNYARNRVFPHESAYPFGDKIRMIFQKITSYKAKKYAGPQRAMFLAEKSKSNRIQKSCFGKPRQLLVL